MRRLPPWIPRLATVPSLCALLLCSAGGVEAQRDTSATTPDGLTSFVNSIGKTLMLLAWPTATYERIAFAGMSPVSNGADIRVRIHGYSSFGGGPLWADVIVMVRDGGVRDVRWGRHNAILARPGETMTALGSALVEMTKEYERSQQARAPVAAAAPAGRGPGEFFVTNNCRLPVQLALAYRNSAGEWIANGWWQLAAGQGSFLTDDRVRLTSSENVWYYFAETTEGDRLTWEGGARVEVRGRFVEMRKVEDTAGDYDLSLTCTGKE